MSKNDTESNYFASCPKGIENILQEELTDLGVSGIKQTAAGVSFSASQSTLYKVLLWTRFANRILMPLSKEKAKDAKELYSAVYQIPWEDYISDGMSFVVDFVGSNDEINNTQFGAQRTKDAIVDRFVRLDKARPNVNKLSPDVRINVRLTKVSLIISLDLSGESLHRRGYRGKQGAAPLKENLAAAVLYRAGWPKLVAQARQENKRIALIDPMCGSGTFLIEAAMMAANMAPGLMRERFACENLASHDKDTWDEVKADAKASMRTLDESFPIIEGSDIDRRVVGIAQENVACTPFQSVIRLTTKPVDDLSLPEDDSELTGLLICNPPYGERLGEIEDLREDYRILGQVVKQALPGWQVGVFTSNTELAREMRLRAKNKYKFFNGKISAELHIFDIVGGESTLREDRDITTAPLSEGAQMVFNRLNKNRRRLDKWIRKEGVECYRLYDADMPEYAAAIDVYGDQYHVQEYQAPKTINEKKAQIRFQEICQATVQAFELHPKQLVSKTRMRQRGSSQYQKSEHQNEKHFFTVDENGAQLRVNLHEYLDTGLFLDHRPLRARIRKEASGKRFLNLFCYTATASVQAILGGAASSVSVDMSNTYLEWAKRNYALNNIHSNQHRLERADCIGWLRNCRQGFDIIMLDPPSFSNSKNTDTVLDIQKDHVQLVNRCMELLDTNGVLYFSNNLRSFKLDPALSEKYDVNDITQATLDPDFERNQKIHSCWMMKNR